MKNFIYKLSVLFVGALVITSCEQNEIPTIDAQNARAIASFNGQQIQTAIFDPSQTTETTFMVGVSTLSNEDRRVQIDISDDSTLDPSFYSIDNLNPVIPAGEFTTEFTVTTIPGTSLPASSSSLVLDLVGIDGAEILAGSIEELTVNLEIKCPDVDLSQIPGTYQRTALTFANFFGETAMTYEIVSGPGENQFTVVGGAYPSQNSEDLIFTVNPETGDVTGIDESKLAYNAADFGPQPYLFLPGGRVLTCAGLVQLRFDFGGSIRGNANTFNLIKQ